MTSIDAVRAIAAITAGVADGEVTPGEAADLSALLTGFAKTLETSELEAPHRSVGNTAAAK